MLCSGVTFVKKNYCLIPRIVSFDTLGLHLLTFRILEPFRRPKIMSLISVTLSHITDVIILPSSYVLFECFQVNQLLKYDDNIVIT